MITTPDFRVLGAKIVELWDADCDIDVEINELRELLATPARPTPPPLAPDYIDPEHHGEDRELLQVFYAACNAEGGTADEIHLRGIRAVMAACPALATPPPEPPTDEELSDLWVNYDGIVDLRDFVTVARAALERWGK